MRIELQIEWLECQKRAKSSWGFETSMLISSIRGTILMIEASDKIENNRKVCSL